jgi:hypothetical protein
MLTASQREPDDIHQSQTARSMPKGIYARYPLVGPVLGDRRDGQKQEIGVREQAAERGIAYIAVATRCAKIDGPDRQPLRATVGQDRTIMSANRRLTTMERVFTTAAGLAAIGALLFAAPANAGITCTLIDQKGHTLTYSFARGGEGFTNETLVKRDNLILSNGGPVWTRVTDREERSETLWQGDWSIAYPWEVNRGRAVLRQRNSVIASGACVPDYSADAPVVVQAPAPATADDGRLANIERRLDDIASRPAQAPAQAPVIVNAPSAPAPAAAPVIINNAMPAPAPVAPAPALASTPAAAPASAPATDTVPVMVIDNAMFTPVIVGGRTVPMQIDTGAFKSSIPADLADRLVSEEHASEAPTTKFTDVNGGDHESRTVIVDNLVIGSHTLKQVEMIVTKGSPVIGLPALKSIGKFTVDADHGLLSFS